MTSGIAFNSLLPSCRRRRRGRRTRGTINGLSVVVLTLFYHSSSRSSWLLDILCSVFCSLENKIVYLLSKTIQRHPPIQSRGRRYCSVVLLTWPPPFCSKIRLAISQTQSVVNKCWSVTPRIKWSNSGYITSEEGVQLQSTPQKYYPTKRDKIKDWLEYEKWRNCGKFTNTGYCSSQCGTEDQSGMQRWIKKEGAIVYGTAQVTETLLLMLPWYSWNVISFV